MSKKVFIGGKISRLDYLLLPSTLVRFLLWLLSVVAVLALFGALTLSAQRTAFESDAHDAINHIHEQLVINDAALTSFASLLAGIGPNNLPAARQFTKSMRDAYPHIYMFEAMISVDPADKAQHQQHMRELGYQDYKITRYGSKKKFNMVDGRGMHFPIFFIDPFLESVKGIMGFDMLSVRTMREPILASLASGEVFASKPYKLREGGRGYTLIKVLNEYNKASPKKYHLEDSKDPGYAQGGMGVLLVIKTDTMIASVADIVPSAHIRLLYGAERELAAEEILPQGVSAPIFEIDTFVKERDLGDLRQPFTLSIQQPGGLYAYDLQLMMLLLLAMCIGYGAYYRVVIAKYRLMQQRNSALVELNHQYAHLEVMVAERTKELQRKSDENTNLAQQLIRVQEDQILHIARELHDEFGQTLTAIKINAHILEGAENMQEVATYAQDITSQADGLYETMRDMIQRLRPEALDMFGLKVAIEQCILAFHLDEQEIELDLNIDDSVNELEEIYTIASYRIVQELVNNTVKHAKLTKLEVRLYVSNQHMHIVVKDNGIGFDPLKHKLGFGLSGVDERARSLGGVVDIRTVIDEGVEVYVHIPLRAS